MTLGTTCTGAILAGGAASRYGGRPKGLERVGGRRIIDRVLEAMRDVVQDVILVANDPGAGLWLPGVPVGRDLLAGAGSVAGIHAALAHAGCPVLVVAWDMPFVNSGLLRALRGLAATTNADVVVPTSASKRGVEPMCAYYAPSCRGPIEAAVARGDRRIVAFFDDVNVTRLDSMEVARFGDPEHIFMNVNSPEDLVRAERYATADHHRGS